MADNSAAYPNVSTAILQGGMQPLDYYLRERNRQENNQVQQAKLTEARRIARDRKLDELNKWSPDKAWSPFDEQVKNAATEVRNKTRDLIAMGYSTDQILKVIEPMRDMVDMIASKSQSIKEQYNNTLKMLDENDMLDSNYYKSRINDELFQEGDFLRGKNIPEIDTSYFNGIVDDVSGYRKDNIAKSIMDKLANNTREFYTKRNDELGSNRYDITEITQNMIGSMNPKTGMPTVNITDEFETIVRQNPYGRALLEDAERKGIDSKDFLKDMFGKYAVYNRSITPKLNKGGSGKDDIIPTEKDLTRFNAVRDVFYNGDKKAIAAAINKIDGVDVDLDAVYPLNDNEIPFNQREDALVITGKPDADGRIKKHVIKFGTEAEKKEAMIILNNLINEQNDSKGRVGSDKFLKMIEEYDKQDPLSIKDKYGILN